MATNDFQVFAGAAGANVMPQSAYLALQAKTTGFATGTAPSPQVNKVWRQSSIIASMLGQFIVDKSGQNAVDDGTIATLESNFILALLNAATTSFDVTNPPTNDINLLVGQRALMTFSNASAIPLRIATVPGVYSITFYLAGNTSNNFDPGLQPNNAVFAPPSGMSSWAMLPSYLYIGGVGTPSAPFAGIVMSPNYQGVLLGTGTGSATRGSFPNFAGDLFFGPAGGDTVNDRGPVIMRWLCSTYTAAKSVQMFGGISGGPTMNYLRWEDTTTAWTSLGTLVDNTGSALMTGAVTTQRLA